VQTVALTWQQAGELAAGLGCAGVGLRLTGKPRLRRIAPFATEAFVLAGLYSLWQLAGKLSLTGASGGFHRAEWIARVEHDWHLPSEASMQRLVLGHPLIVQAANLYYATMHFPMLFVFLGWLFVRHRDQYRSVRTTLALTTLVCLVIQLVPVAPPRLLPGYIDTANQYGQSVYGLGFVADQLSAMPSVHVAWAVLIGWYVVRISPSRWRWIAVAHAAMTVLVVVCTANHWWLDGIVAVAVLVACAWLHRGLAATWHAVRGRSGAPEPLSGRAPAAIVQ